MDVQQLSSEHNKAAYPYCSLELRWTGGEPVKRLHKKVPIKGTDDKDKFFTIRYNPQPGEYIVTMPYNYYWLLLVILLLVLVIIVLILVAASLHGAHDCIGPCGMNIVVNMTIIVVHVLVSYSVLVLNRWWSNGSVKR